MYHLCVLGKGEVRAALCGYALPGLLLE